MSQGSGRFTATALKWTDQPNTEAVEQSLTLDCRAYLDLALDPLPSSLYGSSPRLGLGTLNRLDKIEHSIPKASESNEWILNTRRNRFERQRWLTAKALESTRRHNCNTDL